MWHMQVFLFLLVLLLVAKTGSFFLSYIFKKDHHVLQVHDLESQI